MLLVVDAAIDVASGGEVSPDLPIDPCFIRP